MTGFFGEGAGLFTGFFGEGAGSFTGFFGEGAGLLGADKAGLITIRRHVR